MLDFGTTDISHLSVHQCGNKQNGEQLVATKEEMNIDDTRLQELLLMYFLKPFSDPQFYQFTFSNDDISLNPVCQYVSEIFEHPGSFHHQSIHMAKHLYECANHPNIKAGDLCIAYFSHAKIGDEITDAIGIFKSENKDAFLKLNRKGSGYELRYEDGINIDKMDKGCLIFNTAQETGYKVCTIDKSSRSGDAFYWKDDFLKIKPCADSFHLTNNFLSVTKAYVTNQMHQEFDVSKTDQLDILNKSVEYFKGNEHFNEKEFAESVFYDERVIGSFNEFKSQMQQEADLDMRESFNISPTAVKKQARVFKSILKLDKNFHIYIHGNREMIEKGTEPDGRKFYKIYYNNEDV